MEKRERLFMIAHVGECFCRTLEELRSFGPAPTAANPYRNNFAPPSPGKKDAVSEEQNLKVVRMGGSKGI